MKTTYIFLLLLLLKTAVYAPPQKHFMEYTNGSYTIRGVHSDDYLFSSASIIHESGTIFCSVEHDTADLLWTMAHCADGLEVDDNEIDYIVMYFRILLKNRGDNQ